MPQSASADTGGNMRALRWCLVGLFFVTSVALAQSPEPYIYYFSDILHAFVIERADGSDSRAIGQEVIPATHNAATGAGWSPSGRWLAFTTYYDSGFRGGAWEPNLLKADRGLETNTKPLAEQIPSFTGILSTDGSIVIPIDASSEHRYEPLMLWSPVEDVLFITEGSNPVRIRLFDPNRNQVLYEQELDETLSSYVQWSSDGAQFAFYQRSQDERNVEVLSRSTLQVETVLSFSGRVLSENNGLLTFLDGGELIVHDVFSRAEWRYPAMSLNENDSIEVTWNAQQTQTFIVVSHYISDNRCDNRLYWLSLEEAEFVVLQHNLLDRCDYYGSISWSSDGAKALILRTPNPLLDHSYNRMLPVSGRDAFWIDADHLFGAQETGNVLSGFIIDVNSLQTRRFWWLLVTGSVAGRTH